MFTTRSTHFFLKIVDGWIGLNFRGWWVDWMKRMEVGDGCGWWFTWSELDLLRPLFEVNPFWNPLKFGCLWNIIVKLSCHVHWFFILIIWHLTFHSKLYVCWFKRKFCSETLSSFPTCRWISCVKTFSTRSSNLGVFRSWGFFRYSDLRSLFTSWKTLQ